MKIKLANKPEQLELIKAMGSKNSETAAKARQAFADFIGPVVQEVLNLEGQALQMLTQWPYNEDDNPEFPLDQYYNSSVDHIVVWQQNMAGGLGTSLVTGLSTLKLHTYRLDSAVSLLESNVRRGRLPYVSLAINRLKNELLKKQELNRWLIILKALGEAQTGSNKHVIASNSANILQVDDFNRWLTRSKLINTAFDGEGTPDASYSNGATDAWMSPEGMEQIRGFAYQPMNTRAVPNTDESTAVPLPDAMRQRIYEAAGLPEIYGITLHELLEFGISRVYNTIFGKNITGTINGPGGSAFATATDELVLGYDMTKDALIRPVAQNAESGAEIVMEVDDQFSRRSGKLGWFTAVEEGVCCIDSRALSGIVW